MRHYPEIRPDLPRLERLFQLQRQRDVQTLLDTAGAREDDLRPDIALRLQQAAIRSLQKDHASEEPRKPVATTNFSELSDREAGGFTFATFVKRCLSSF
ncbi:hypothetical protein SAMN05443551_2838 [Marivita hallyeonensis]|uniref:Uncharacterized protein n=1 Tax=Marivita hallyeonensis TaxID=996342 RepID=A0A1M5VFS1_9RHOB|nr:hypothetical protein SAMN05443551_2838 [Marivita hallyeonensis]